VEDVFKVTLMAVEDVEVEADVADVSVMTGTRMVIRGA